MNDILVASTDPVWLQVVFDTLTGLFERVGLRTYVKNTVSMICFSFHGVSTQSEGSYERHMTGEGLAYWTQQRLRVQCPDRGKYLVVGFLAFHWKTQYFFT